MSKTYELTVAGLRRTTPQSLTITFDVPPQWAEEFTYRAGQFLTLSFTISGRVMRRAYSLNSSPALDEPLEVTVSRVNGGVVSNHIHNHLAVGDGVQVMPPAGNFKPDINPDNHRTWYLYAAGSGITPLLSVLKTVLTIEPYSWVYLFYGSRDEDNIILRDEISNWEARYPKRLTVVHSLSKPLSRRWSALLSTRKSWSGPVGRIDSQAVRKWINAYPPPAQTVRYLICGPGHMIDDINETLIDMDVPPADILFERFGAKPKNNPAGHTSAVISVRLAGMETDLTAAPGQTLLSVMREAGIDAPFSCESGICGACVCKLVSGEVHPGNVMALDATDQAHGKILSCQAIAKSSRLEICDI